MDADTSRTVSLTSSHVFLFCFVFWRGIQCPVCIHINEVETYFLWCRLTVAPRARFLFSWNWHALYMFCDPMLIIYKCQPCFMFTFQREPAVPTGENIPIIPIRTVRSNISWCFQRAAAFSTMKFSVLLRVNTVGILFVYVILTYKPPAWPLTLPSMSAKSCGGSSVATIAFGKRWHHI